MTEKELRPYKADPGDKLIEKSCETCEFNFGDVCACSANYGTSMKTLIKKYPEGCDSWGISFDAFMEQEELNGR